MLIKQVFEGITLHDAELQSFEYLKEDRLLKLKIVIKNFQKRWDSTAEFVLNELVFNEVTEFSLDGHQVEGYHEENAEIMDFVISSSIVAEQCRLGYCIDRSDRIQQEYKDMVFTAQSADWVTISKVDS